MQDDTDRFPPSFATWMHWLKWAEWKVTAVSPARWTHMFAELYASHNEGTAQFYVRSQWRPNHGAIRWTGESLWGRPAVKPPHLAPPWYKLPEDHARLFVKDRGLYRYVQDRVPHDSPHGKPVECACGREKYKRDTVDQYATDYTINSVVRGRRTRYTPYVCPSNHLVWHIRNSGK